MSKPNIVEAMSDRRLFEPWFRGRSWDGWKAMLKAAHGIPMQPEEIKLLHKLAERDPPKRQGRKSGRRPSAPRIFARRPRRSTALDLA